MLRVVAPHLSEEDIEELLLPQEEAELNVLGLQLLMGKVRYAIADAWLAF